MLEARHLTCQRGGRTLFQGLSFQLAEGELLEVRGGNGSGKSRLLRILAGITKDWSGQLEVRRPTLYLGHENSLHPRLTVKENLEWAASLVGAPGEAIGKSLRVLNARHLLNHVCETLSVGQSRRVALARLIFDEAPLWLLDEPTNSLDTEGRGCFRTLLAEHLQTGGAAVIATHSQDRAGDQDKVDAAKQASHLDDALIAQRGRRLMLGGAP